MGFAKLLTNRLWGKYEIRYASVPCAQLLILLANHVYTTELVAVLPHALQHNATSLFLEQDHSLSYVTVILTYGGHYEDLPAVSLIEPSNT